MRAAPACVALLLPALSLLAGGCAIHPLIVAHDAILGPVSPAGKLRGATTGRDFQATNEGISVDLTGEPVLRPYSPDIIRRLAFRPRNLEFMQKGLRAYVASISPLVRKVRRQGTPVDDEARESLRPGMPVGEVLRRLGTPQLWIREVGGSLMGYHAEVDVTWAFYVGVPPGVGDLIPIPGVSSLSFRFTSRAVDPLKTYLFFDRDDALVAAVTNTNGDMPGEEAEQ